jgi:hypothetical protein
VSADAHPGDARGQAKLFGHAAQLRDPRADVAAALALVGEVAAVAFVELGEQRHLSLAIDPELAHRHPAGLREHVVEEHASELGQRPVRRVVAPELDPVRIEELAATVCRSQESGMRALRSTAPDRR